MEEFFGGNLDDDGEGDDDENKSDDWQDEDGIGHHGDHAKGGSK